MICTFAPISWPSLTLKKPWSRLLFPMPLIILTYPHYYQGWQRLVLNKIFTQNSLSLSFCVMCVCVGITEALNLWNRQSRQRESKRNCQCQNRRMGEDRAPWPWPKNERFDRSQWIKHLQHLACQLHPTAQQLVGNEGRWSELGFSEMLQSFQSPSGA